jgi:hypothetical protein
MSEVGTVERAFELARSGECANVREIRDRLKEEGFSHVMEHLDGAFIKRQLSELIKAARTAESAFEN